MKNLQEKIEELISESKYDEAGELFVKETGIEMTVEFKENGYHFDSDKETRDIYDITIKRNGREYSFNFGQSIADSGFYVKIGVNKYDIDRKYLESKDIKSIVKRMNWNFDSKLDKIHYPKKPNAYTIFSCLKKHDPESFENFCSEFGYDTDSKRADKTYNAVLDEWLNLQRIFTNEEMEAMAEIS